MSLFKGIALFVGWVTSSLAGIAAILYACGYLITQAQLRSLGLSGILERAPDYYLQEGANFFIGLVSRLPAMFPWLFWAGCIFVFLLILGLPVAIYLAKNKRVSRKRERVMRFFEKVRYGITEAFERQPWLWRSAAYLLSLCILIFYLTRYLSDFTPALNVSNLLYVDPANERMGLARAILTGNNGKLENHFGLLLWGTLQTGIVLALAWSAIRPARLKVWLIAPFAVIFLIYVLFLPLAYGTLLRPTRFPVVALTSGSPLLAGVKGSLFLLHKTDGAFVLWDKQARRVLWIPSDQIQAAEVKGFRPLFAKPQSGP